ncbi:MULTISPECIES: hybrid sensor histidine kinase/response regulator [unclassified Saccharicrinis]|uniref:hybrid sensor histidine kinase/response regulator n=1 Tax=unclassified Saccharicrinis TaxID=2646859 RepID=UPI003D34420C
MASDSLENTSGLQSLEAENRHLKSMLNRYVSSKKEGSEDVASLVSNQIEKILTDASDFDIAMSSCLRVLGNNYSVDRVSVFAYNEGQDAYVAQKQWVNSSVQEYHPADLTIASEENPLTNTNIGNCFASSEFKDEISRSLTDKFEIFGVQSLLIVPVNFSQYKKAMLVMESCAFKREWYHFEVKEIEREVSLMAARIDALWHKSNAARLWYLNTLRNQILHKIKRGKRTKKSLNEALKTIGIELGLRSVYFVDKSSFSNGHELSWTQTAEHEEELLSNQDLEKLDLNCEENTGRYFDAKTIKSAGIDLVQGTSFLLINRVVLQSEFGGWLIGEFTNYTHYISQELIQFWDSIAITLSDIMGNTNRELEHNDRYSELLEQNRDLVIKEILLEKVLDDSPLAVLIVEKGKIKFVNKQVTELSGYSEREIVGRNTTEFYGSSRELEDKIKGFYQGINSAGYKKDEIELPCKNGDKKRFSIYGFKGVDGNEESYLIYAQDITEAYQEQEKIKTSNERYKTITESSFDGALIIDVNHAIRYVNKATCSIVERDFDELALLSASDIVHKKSLKAFEEAVHAIGVGEGYKGDLVMCTKAGAEVEVELAGTLIYMDNQSYCYFTVHDISNRKKNEKALSDSERKFRTLAQNSPDIILRLNEAGEIKFFNQAFINRFNVSNADNVLGNTLQNLEVLDEVVMEAWLAKIKDVFAVGETVSLEHGFGHAVKELYVDWRLTPETNENGTIETVLAVGRNLATHKNTEKQLVLAKEKAEESDKLKSEFLANISHELRTPLNAIVGFSSLLRGSHIKPNEVDEYVDVIHKNSDSLMNLINNIIDVAKIERGKISVVKDNVILDDLLQSIYDDFVPRVEVEHKGRVKLYYSKPEEARVKIMTDSIRLRQILVNLLGNAMKFTIKGFIEFGFAIENNRVRIYVKDTGIGISEAKQKIIFQPFRKGHEEDADRLYRGTGIGLAICEKLISALGGEIGLISEKAKGSEFYFTHPMGFDIADKTKATLTKHILSPILRKNYSWTNKMMLLVDQNSSAHLQMRKYIEKTGITLVSARTAAGASKLLMNRTDIHLVLMDMSFPDSDGYELVKIIKRLNKNIPVIAHTSDAINGQDLHVSESGFDACIAKPAEKDELLALMDQFLVEAQG